MHLQNGPIQSSSLTLRWLILMAVIASAGICVAYFGRTENALSKVAQNVIHNQAITIEPTVGNGTHQQAFTIKPTFEGLAVKLETFCVGPRGQLWMACQSMSGERSGLILVYDPNGSLSNSFPLSFVPQAIDFSPNNKLYVAGSGKIARVALNGKVEIEIDAPNIGNRDDAIDSARKAAEESAAKLKSSREQQTKILREQIAKLEKAPVDESEKDKGTRERRLKILQQQIKSQAASVVVRQLSEVDVLKRLKRSTAIAATNNEVFVACPESSGYGYGVWRLSPDLKLESKVIEGGRGCCGQFDIQTDGEHLVLAENTKFQVGIYDRNGKQLSSFGKKSREDIDGFGSCCNPMNVQCLPNGEILTAESSIGHIKRFSRDGKLLGFVGTAKVAGGCKHVAIGFDSDRDQYYMMHQDLSHVAVLVPVKAASKETVDMRQTPDTKESE